MKTNININQHNKKKLTLILITISSVLFILSFSIAVPILVRPFYYIQTDLLSISETSGYSKETIITAYDEMLDYCIGKSNVFSTGDLAFSPEGKAHFDDVKFLFMLDFTVLLITFIILLSYFTMIKLKKRTYVTVGNKGPLFWGGILLSALFVIIFTYVALDFDSAFTGFHNLFFPGKTNWIFDREKDQIINILPEVFFRNCAIAALITMCLLIILSVFLDKRIKKTTLL